MGQVDFGKIISAAAVSTLGVLSLIVVALGVLAFYFFKCSPEKVKLSVWWTALLAGGLFAVAFIKQANTAGEPDPAPVRTSAPSASDVPVPLPSDTPIPVPSQRPGPVARPPMGAGVLDPANLTGRWDDTDGYLYDVTAYGNVFMYQQYLNGANVGSGQGSREGQTLRYGFLSKQDGGQGQCHAIIAADQRSISGTCESGGERWPFFVER